MLLRTRLAAKTQAGDWRVMIYLGDISNLVVSILYYRLYLSDSAFVIHAKLKPAALEQRRRRYLMAATDKTNACRQRF